MGALFGAVIVVWYGGWNQVSHVLGTCSSTKLHPSLGVVSKSR
jgi:hypothetical protein